MGTPNPKRSEALRRRWADPAQRELMLSAAAKGHERTAAKLRGDPPPTDPPPADPPPTDPPPARRPGILGALFTSSPRDVVDRLRGRV